MAGIVIGQVLDNNAVDASFNPVPNVDGKYGPYATREAALAAIPTDARAVGLTVGIKTGNAISEYWFNGGIADTHLVKKQQSGGGGGGLNIEITTDVTDTTTYLETQFPNAAIPTLVVDRDRGGCYIKFDDASWVKLNGTILTAALPTVASVVAANVLAYK